MRIRRNSNNRTSTTECCDATIDGRECQIEFTRVTTWAHDAHYGADADGNRGVPMDFVEEDCAEAITINFIDEPGEPVTAQSIRDQHPLLYAEIAKAIDAYLERVEPTVEDGPDDRDEARDDGRDRDDQEEWGWE